MAGRAAAARRLPENDPTIAYVQADGLVSILNIRLLAVNARYN